jgi:hypothetical protein
MFQLWKKYFVSVCGGYLLFVYNKSFQHHFGATHLRWTVFKSRFCGLAAQKYPQNHNLKTAAELGVMEYID